MPIYEYKCKLCHHKGERLQKIEDPKTIECPECGKHSFERQISAAGFQLKGTGWYVTDFKDKKELPAKENKPTAPPSTDTKANE